MIIKVVNVIAVFIVIFSLSACVADTESGAGSFGSNSSSSSTSSSTSSSSTSSSTSSSSGDPVGKPQPIEIENIACGAEITG